MITAHRSGTDSGVVVGAAAVTEGSAWPGGSAAGGDAGSGDAAGVVAGAIDVFA